MSNIYRIILNNLIKKIKNVNIVLIYYRNILFEKLIKFVII